MKQLMDNVDYKGIEDALSGNSVLANEGLPFDDTNKITAHPLHRLCDGVFAGTYSDEQAVKMAKIFLRYGARIDGTKPVEKADTPLLAASSLHADQLAILYIEQGANIHHAGCHGGTALHWAAWCARPIVVQRPVESGAAINQRCIDFQSTPLFWAIHGLKNGGSGSSQETLHCVKILLKAGADKTIPNADGNTIFDLLSGEDAALKEALQ